MLPVPVTVVSGFLGSGKTTLVNRILSAKHGLAIAVIVNDVGSVNVDAALLNEISDNVVSLKNGCVCCSMRTDLVAQIAGLVAENNLDHIVIEASGVSEPGNIVRGLKYPTLRGKVIDSAVVTLIDAELFPELNGNSRYLAHEQLAAADLILLNKTDLVSSQRIEQLKKELACPGAIFVECSYADAPLEMVFCDHYTDKRRQSATPEASTIGQFESKAWQPGNSVDLVALRDAVGALSGAVYRVKGYVRCAQTGDCWLVQRVGHRVNVVRVLADQTSALVLIGERDRIEWSQCFNSLEACVAADMSEASFTASTLNKEASVR